MVKNNYLYIFFVLFIFSVFLIFSNGEISVNSDEINNIQRDKKNIIEVYDIDGVYSLREILWKFYFIEDPENYIYVKMPHEWTKKNGLIDYETKKPLKGYNPQKIDKNIYQKIGVYEAIIDIKTDIKESSSGVVIKFIDNKDQTFFNDILIGGHGNIYKIDNKFYNDKTRIYEIPAKYLKKGENILKISIQGGGIYQGQIYFGKFDKIITNENVLNFFNLSLLAVYVIIGFYYILLFFYNIKGNKDFIFFALLSLSVAIYLFTRNQIKYFVFDIEKHFFILKAIEFYILSVCFSLWLHFVYSYLKKKSINILTISFDTYLIFYFIYVIINFYNIQNYSDLHFKVNINLMLIICLYTVFLIVYYAIFKKNRDARLISIGLLIFLITVINDILLAISKMRGVQLVNFGFFLMILQIGFVLGARYSKLYHESVIANKNIKFLYDSTLKLTKNSQHNLKAVIEVILDLSFKFLDAISACYYTIENNKFKFISKIGEIETENNITIEYLKDKEGIVKDFDKNQIIFAISSGSNIQGVIKLQMKKNADLNAFDNLLKAFSTSCSITLENILLNEKMIEKEKLEKEMEIASQIQTAILPRDLNSNNFEIAAEMITADMVGGDYYDYIKIRDSEYFCIGDVTGHGVNAGIVMLMVQSMVRVLLESKDYEPDELLTILNGALFDNVNKRLLKNDYLTLTIFKYSNNKLIYSGLHIDFFIYKKQLNKVERIKSEGIWTGVIQDVKGININKELEIENGDIILLFTDGLNEAMDDNNEQYDYERIEKSFSDNLNKNCKEIIENIIKDVKMFSKVQKDDITILCLKKK